MSQTEVLDAWSSGFKMRATDQPRPKDTGERQDGYDFLDGLISSHDERMDVLERSVDNYESHTHYVNTNVDIELETDSPS